MKLDIHPGRTGQSPWDDEPGMRNIYKTVEMNSRHSITKKGHSIVGACEFNMAWLEIQAGGSCSEPKREAAWDGVRKPLDFWLHRRVALHGNFSEMLARRKPMHKHLRAGRLKEVIHLIGEKERTAVEDRYIQCLSGELTEINHQDQTSSIWECLRHLGLWLWDSCLKQPVWKSLFGEEKIFSPTLQDPLYLWRKTIHIPNNLMDPPGHLQTMQFQS